MRYFIDITYDGTAYHGWQIQKNALSVQQIVNESLTLILEEKINTIGSGRTDTQVHAFQQIAHFDTQKPVKTERLKDKLNSYLPKDIAVNHIRKVNSDVHARYDASLRCYEYMIIQKKDPFYVKRAYYYRRILNLDKMNSAAELLKTSNDFQSFSRVKTEVNHFKCKVKEAHWTKINELVIFSICADRFLRGMVRALVGTMLDIGTDKITISDFEKILKYRDRKKAGRAVPAYGLYLKSVTYPDHIYQ